MLKSASSSRLMPVQQPQQQQTVVLHPTTRLALEERIRDLEKRLSERDELVQELTSQLDKYRSVFPKPPAFDRTASTTVLAAAGSGGGGGNGVAGRVSGLAVGCAGVAAGTNGTAAAAECGAGVANGPKKHRNQGVSAEPIPVQRNFSELEKEAFRTYPKTQRSAELTKQAIQANDFMKHLSPTNTREIVDCMYPVDFKPDTIIIREGDVGSRVYVLEEGRVEVTKDGRKLGIKTPPTVLGELAILYNCTRTATVRALDYCKLWAIDRHVFQAIMMKTEILRQKQCIDWLRNVPRMKSLPDETLHRVANAMEEVHYKNGECILKHGARNEAFYIIAKGKCSVYLKESRRLLGSRDDSTARHLTAGQYFGEQALDEIDVRTTTILATDSDGVNCFVIDRTAFSHLVNDVTNKQQQQQLLQQQQLSEPAIDLLPSTKARESSTATNGQLQQQQLSAVAVSDPLSSVRQISDLVVMATIGVGGFGRVELVQIRSDLSGKTYALKMMKKRHIVDTCQQEHIMNEKHIMAEAHSDFIVRLHKTFKDAKYLYMVLEACLGGELWSLLRDRLAFDDTTTRFYCACVLEAFNYLHSRCIIYRDLKPENLLLDRAGYVKLVDFGFAKRIGVGRRTWTFCGTPEYVAPEIILNKGHDMACDLWSLGILTFELLTGCPPFTSSEPMKTYNLILKGISSVDFPRKISKHAHSFIKKLCKADPTERLGYGPNGTRDIHKHKWFDGFGWESLRKRVAKVPYLPKIKSLTDTSNFDVYPPDDVAPPPDDTSGWDDDF